MYRPCRQRAPLVRLRKRRAPGLVAHPRVSATSIRLVVLERSTVLQLASSELVQLDPDSERQHQAQSGVPVGQGGPMGWASSASTPKEEPRHA